MAPQKARGGKDSGSPGEEVRRENEAPRATVWHGKPEETPPPDAPDPDTTATVGASPSRSEWHSPPADATFAVGLALLALFALAWALKIGRFGTKGR